MTQEFSGLSYDGNMRPPTPSPPLRINAQNASFDLMDFDKLQKLLITFSEVWIKNNSIWSL